MTRKERAEVMRRVRRMPEALIAQAPELWAYVTAPGVGEPRHRAVIDQLIDLLRGTR